MIVKYLNSAAVENMQGSKGLIKNRSNFLLLIPKIQKTKN